MGLSQLLLDGSLSGNGLTARLCHRLSRMVARLRDPLVRYPLHGRTLVLPLSHDLPWNRRMVPTYAGNLARLAAEVRRRAGVLRMIDVGANVGDSWCLADSTTGDAFLLIEGDPRFAALLERNTAEDPGVTRVLALLSDRLGSAPGGLSGAHGNAGVTPGAPGPRECRTLDLLLDEHPEFRSSNLLKTDVEGMDGRVLAGGRRLLAEARPVVLFEHHPRLIERLGDDTGAVFRLLREAGYEDLIVYDNRGFLLGRAATADTARLAELEGYARQQNGVYYDLCAFHASRADWGAAFLSAEQARITTSRGAS